MPTRLQLRAGPADVGGRQGAEERAAHTGAPVKPVAAAAPDRRNVFNAVPFMRLLGVQREFSQDGRARLVLEERAELGNVIGAVHGGVIVTLLDVAMASAAVSSVDFTRTAVTLNLDSSFLEPGRD